MGCCRWLECSDCSATRLRVNPCLLPRLCGCHKLLPASQTCSAASSRCAWRRLRALPTTSASLEPRMRCDLTGELCAPPDCSADAAPRYVRDRVNVPRDMSVWAVRRLRHALETNASIAGPKQAPAIPADHRRDQNPASFKIFLPAPASATAAVKMPVYPRYSACAACACVRESVGRRLSRRERGTVRINVYVYLIHQQRAASFPPNQHVLRCFLVEPLSLRSKYPAIGSLASNLPLR